MSARRGAAAYAEAPGSAVGAGAHAAVRARAAIALRGRAPDSARAAAWDSRPHPRLLPSSHSAPPGRRLQRACARRSAARHGHGDRHISHGVRGSCVPPRITTRTVLLPPPYHRRYLARARPHQAKNFAACGGLAGVHGPVNRNEFGWHCARRQVGRGFSGCCLTRSPPRACPSSLPHLTCHWQAAPPKVPSTVSSAMATTPSTPPSPRRARQQERVARRVRR